MKYREMAQEFGFAFLAALLAAAGTGCVAVNVGKPEVYRHTETRRETAARPARTVVASAGGRQWQTGERAVVGISAELRDEYPRTRWEETVTVRRQKRLGIGLFPGAAEAYLMPRGALKSGMGLFREWDREEPEYCAYYGQTEWDYGVLYVGNSILMLGLSTAIGTVNSLLVQPFADWPCHHDLVDGENLRKGVRIQGHGPFADASGSPKIQALGRFTPGERRKMGVRTCWDPMLKDDDLGPAVGLGWTHMGLAGCHKHLAVFVDPVKTGPREDDGAETRTRRVDVPGPYLAELSIPALGFKRVQRVEGGSTRAEFALPAGPRECIAEAVARFRPDPAGGAADAEARMVLEQVAGKAYRFDVALRAGAPTPPKSEPPPSSTSVPPHSLPPPPVLPAPPSRADGALWEVTGIRRTAGGRYEVRVAIADRSKTFDIGWAVETEVRGIIREDFVNRHPGTGIQYVHGVVDWETEENGAVLVYRGWAFSARPVSDGWTYDDGARRGTVRLRISEGMPADEAKRWARENIEAIVKEKNVALEAGKAPPEGAVYRSLGETLEDGVLTVEFEAVE